MKPNRLEIWGKFGGKCAYCGVELDPKKFQVDHITPHWHKLTEKEANSIGVVKGTNETDNLNPSCTRCNKWKSTWSVEQFRKEIELQIERINRYSSSYRIAKDYGLIKETDEKVKFYFENF
jgi:5-methylcytosine-specific restriction endonuclease McrA